MPERSKGVVLPPEPWLLTSAPSCPCIHDTDECDGMSPVHVTGHVWHVTEKKRLHYCDFAVLCMTVAQCRRVPSCIFS